VAERVHELIDIEKVSMRDAAKILQSEGWKMNSGNVWYAYRRWYEMQGQTMPRNPYNNGHSRRKRGEGGGEMPMPPMVQT
jgi:site-specific DNA recombinase